MSRDELHNGDAADISRNVIEVVDPLVPVVGNVGEVMGPEVGRFASKVRFDGVGGTVDGGAAISNEIVIVGGVDVMPTTLDYDVG